MTEIDWSRLSDRGIVNSLKGKLKYVYDHSYIYAGSTCPMLTHGALAFMET
jgi:hypothetical protein